MGGKPCFSYIYLYINILYIYIFFSVPLNRRKKVKGLERLKDDRNYFLSYPQENELTGSSTVILVVCLIQGVKQNNQHLQNM